MLVCKECSLERIVPVNHGGLSVVVKDASMGQTEVKGSLCIGSLGKKEFPNSGIRRLTEPSISRNVKVLVGTELHSLIHVPV